MQLRPYQNTLLTNIFDSWGSWAGTLPMTLVDGVWQHQGHRVVLAVAPTGSGKTVLFSEAIRLHNGASVAIAHRQELVSQMSLALARDEVRHRIIGPQSIVSEIVQLHIQELGRDYYDPSARCAVAGVDTLVRRGDELARWCPQVTLWVQDEGHHQLVSNKWGTAAAMFPNARGLLVTATPERADGKGLGRHADGLVDCMVEGPGMRQLITDGYLTDYRIFCPPSDLDLSTVAIGADGDYVRGQLAMKTRSSTIMGHVVEHYLRIAPGKLGVTFAPDVETAMEFARLFNSAGVKAEAVSAKTPSRIRIELLRRFRRREILQLVNCDLFSEGFDLPAIEVVTMARATQSYGLYAQQFGRVLRILDGKDVGIIIDHVGNVVRHGLPDSPRAWTLDRRDRRSSTSDPNVIPLRNCLNPECMAPFERVHPTCPFCGWVPVPAGRTAPEQVDGDLCELDPAVLAAMRGELEKVDRHPDAVRTALERAGQAPVVYNGAAKQHAVRQVAQGQMRELLSMWMGYQKAYGRGISEAQRRFYHRFGVDVLSAQVLGRSEAEGLMARVGEDLMRGVR
jgi:DNA repair protein RadD